MQLQILGSSSSGNCYILGNESECLIIELGISFKNVQKALNFDLKRVKGAIISHEHQDHAKQAENALKWQIPVYCSHGTAQAIGISGNYLCNELEALKPVQVGNFRICGFDTQHDAAQPFGFLIHHPECGMVMFATDTYYLQYQFGGLSNIMIECNYRQDILDANVEAGKIPAKLRNRTMKSHMEFETCLETLTSCDLSKVNNILLIHLSDGNSNATEFQQAIAQETGKNVMVARPGMIIPFNKTPF